MDGYNTSGWTGTSNTSLSKLMSAMVLATPMCPTCGTNPIQAGYMHCSKSCALGAPAPKQTTRVVCPQCQQPTFNPEYTYCSRECAIAAGSGTPHASRILRKKRPCAIEGCEISEYAPGSKYCSRPCQRMAVQLKLEPACLVCMKLPKLSRSHYCGRGCTMDASSRGPCLLGVPTTDPIFQVVIGQFMREWKHTDQPPVVRYLYYIVLDEKSSKRFDKRKAEIDSRFDFASSGMPPANMRRRWHGTLRECQLGDDHEHIGLCVSPTCKLCVIIRGGYDVQYCTPGSMFGKGIYTSATSSKSNIYVKQTTPSRYKAVLLNRVLAGNAIKLTEADHSLVKPPKGYDSVRGVPGTGLKYDELIVYDNDAIRPEYLLVYDNI